MKVRPEPINLFAEPAYPEHETVLFPIDSPDWTAHFKHELCNKEYPHLIKDCGIFSASNSNKDVDF